MVLLVCITPFGSPVVPEVIENLDHVVGRNTPFGSARGLCFVLPPPIQQSLFEAVLALAASKQIAGQRRQFRTQALDHWLIVEAVETRRRHEQLALGQTEHEG
jgi:hypothetical protein